MSSTKGEIKFQKVLYVPGVTKNLLSVGKIADQNYGVYFNSTHYFITEPLDLRNLGQIIASGTRDRHNGLYKFSSQVSEALVITSIESSQVWHDRLGHLHTKSIVRLSRQQLAKGIPTDLSYSTPFYCSSCQLGRQTRKSAPKIAHFRARRFLELVHSDLCSPISPASSSGTSYILTFTDDFSRYCWLYFLKRKSDTFRVFQQFCALLDNRHKRRIGKLRTDGGGEFCSLQFQAFCASMGIERQVTEPHSPHQNGVAERKNRTLLERARCLMVRGSLPNFLWSELVATANFLINRTPTRANQHVTPFQ